MTKKQCPDFALIAGAMARDQQMAEQVCQLIGDEDVTEAEGRKMLTLISEGKLSSPMPNWMYTYPAIPTYTYPQPYLPTITSTITSSDWQQ